MVKSYIIGSSRKRIRKLLNSILDSENCQSYKSQISYLFLQVFSKIRVSGSSTSDNTKKNRDLITVFLKLYDLIKDFEALNFNEYNTDFINFYDLIF